MVISITPVNALGGTIAVPGDKSIAHRALIIGAHARGWTRVVGLPSGEDVQSTARVLVECGVRIERSEGCAVIHGRGSEAIAADGKKLDCGNSGTTMRLMTGVLCGRSSGGKLVGDASLSRRPMGRVVVPLQAMGAKLELNDNHAPIMLCGGRLEGTDLTLQNASAQVKSAILLAALRARGRTRITGTIASRDHTERMLEQFGARIAISDREIVIEGNQDLSGRFMTVPGDPSSAAYWIAAALIVPNASLSVRGILLNTTRTRFFEVLARMGAKIDIQYARTSPELVGTIHARAGPLAAVHVAGGEVPFLIDELPLLAVLATYAKGTTIVRGAQELRLKESDRIEGIATGLRSMGAHIETFPDGFAVKGPQSLKGGDVDPIGDHRVAMALTVAALRAKGETVIRDAQCVKISYPEFYNTLWRIAR